MLAAGFPATPDINTAAVHHVRGMSGARTSLSASLISRFHIEPAMHHQQLLALMVPFFVDDSCIPFISGSIAMCPDRDVFCNFCNFLAHAYHSFPGVLRCAPMFFCNFCNFLVLVASRTSFKTGSRSHATVRRCKCETISRANTQHDGSVSAVYCNSRAKGLHTLVVPISTVSAPRLK